MSIRVPVLLIDSIGEDEGEGQCEWIVGEACYSYINKEFGKKFLVCNFEEYDDQRYLLAGHCKMLHHVGMHTQSPSHGSDSDENVGRDSACSTGSSLGSDDSQDNESEEDHVPPAYVGTRVIRDDYSDTLWNSAHRTFDVHVVEFFGLRSGPTIRHTRPPSRSSLYGQFWSHKVLRQICRETNWYASLIPHLPSKRRRCSFGDIRGGKRWFPLTVPELKAYMGINIMMGVCKQPSMRSY